MTVPKTDTVIIAREGVVGRLSLNRPAALHALTRPMVTAMTEALLAWRHDAGVSAIIIDHAAAPGGSGGGAYPKAGRGFCAGGDINLARRSVLEDDGVTARAFFLDEYRLNQLLFAFTKPVISFMDGITMGGGVGIALPAAFRVATPNTRLAMPETGIGLFPDVGGGWYLSRLAGRIGQFIALTGARLDGAECLWTGLATHHLPVEALPDAKARIAGGDDPARVLTALATIPPPARLAANACLIARHFASDRFEDLLASLAGAAAEPGGEWAAKELATLRSKSPLSCKVALRQLALGAAITDFAGEMALEYGIASRMILRPDFTEGVRAVIVDKDNAPRWNPARPEDVTEAMVDAIFAPLPPHEQWSSM